MGKSGKHEPGRWARWYLYGLIVVALAANFIANDRPIVANFDGHVVWPVLSEVNATTTGVAVRNWNKATTKWSIWPPITYNGTSSDLSAARYQPPLSQGKGPGRHWLGTDKLGRDTAAGLVYGTRVALAVGFGSVLLALLLGVPIGGAAGFFGNHGWAVTRAMLLAVVLGVVVGVTYTQISLLPFLQLDGWVSNLLLTAVTVAVTTAATYYLLRLLPPLRHPTYVPADTITLQFVEVFVNIPGAVLLLVAISLAPQPSLGLLVALIGLLLWPKFAVFIRSELIRIRSLPYIKAAQVSGIGKWRLLFVHALPNAAGPVLVTAGFMVVAAILLEAFLSFLGIGIPNDVATWGTILRRSRAAPAAWWLAVFPGLLLTLTVLAIQRVCQLER